MNIIIVGGGKVGYRLASLLAEDKHEVAIIEKNRVTCEEIASKIDVLVIHGDGCESRYLEDAGIRKADVIAAVTGDDEDNIVICQLAKRKFNVPRTVARVNDPKNEHLFNVLGVDVPVNSTSIIAHIIEEEASLDDFVKLMTFKRGKLAIIRVDIQATSPGVNKPLKSLKLPPQSVIVSIVRGEDVFVPGGETILKEGDDLIAITTIEYEQELLDVLLGEISI
jgi:trk system potassium uptake protein TrkA